MPASLTVPLEAVQLKDGEDLVSPGNGDTVSINIEATVDSVADGSAVVSVSSANGIDFPQTAEEPDAEPEVQPEEDHDAAKADFLASLDGKEI